LVALRLSAFPGGPLPKQRGCLAAVAALLPGGSQMFSFWCSTGQSAVLNAALKMSYLEENSLKTTPICFHNEVSQ
jgi:hypothetical protein